MDVQISVLVPVFSAFGDTPRNGITGLYGREPNHKRLLKTENKLRVDGVGERGEWVMGMEEGTCWEEHWMLSGNQFDNKLY